MIFSDFSTPNHDRFNVYDDIRAKLVSKGIPNDEIAFIHDADTEAKKKALFQKVRLGQVRIMLGSTQKMGAGTNVQDLLIASHDLDAPWRPADLTQRAGRIVRRGNKNPNVHIYRYVTEGTFDAYLYQTLENKQRFISQVMTSKSPVRACEDVDETVLSFAEIKGLCANNPLIVEKMLLDVDVERLKAARKNYENERFELEHKLMHVNPKQLAFCVDEIESLQKVVERMEPLDNEGHAPAYIDGMTFKKFGDAAEKIQSIFDRRRMANEVEIGSYRGFSLFASETMNINLMGRPERQRTLRLRFPEEKTFSRCVELGDSPLGFFPRINNVIKDLSKEIKELNNKIEVIRKDTENIEEALKKPFAKEEEYQKKLTRLAALNAELTLSENKTSPSDDSEEAKGVEGPSKEASVQQPSTGQGRENDTPAALAHGSEDFGGSVSRVASVKCPVQDMGGENETDSMIQDAIRRRNEATAAYYGWGR